MNTLWPMQVNREIQGTLPGIDFAPELVRDHGLREAHTYPLVSTGKHGGVVKWFFPRPCLGRLVLPLPGAALGWCMARPDPGLRWHNGILPIHDGSGG